MIVLADKLFGNKNKRALITGLVTIILGMLIALGPQTLFKVCGHGEGGFPLCHWSARAEIGVGLLIASLGICLFAFSDLGTHLGLSIGIFLTSIIALFIPLVLIGGCNGMDMACRRVAFPSITMISLVLLVFTAVSIFFLNRAIRRR